jgi:hypothetical protein
VDEGLLERVWKYREETLYRRLFGDVVRGIFVIPYEMFAKTFSQTDVDPRWLHYGAFEYAPTSARSSWLYVTSGMSTPWEAEEAAPSAVSGLGCEFIFESSVQGDWAIRRLLQLMAYQVLLCHGRYPGRDPLGVFDRLPLRGPIWDGESDVQFLMVAPPDSSTGTQQLESGSFELQPVVGLTDAEAAFARVQGGEALLERLWAAGAFPVTDPHRRSVSLGN